MLVFLGALVAGVLTTLAPCVLPLLPIIVGGSVGSTQRPARVGRALQVCGALAASVFGCTLLLKGTTLLLDVPAWVWPAISGGLLVALGLVGLFPELWERLAAIAGLQERTTAALGGARNRSGWVGAVLTGAALGPVFSSCSPLYGYVVVTVLPTSLGTGMALLTAYVIGLGGALLGVSLLGQRLIGKLGWAADASGAFRRCLSAVFMAIGLAVLFGWDRAVQTWLVEHVPAQVWVWDAVFVPR